MKGSLKQALTLDIVQDTHTHTHFPWQKRRALYYKVTADLAMN